jgi:hypothetical protein
MNTPNPDTLAKQGPSQYDNLSDDELLKLLNDASRIKRGHGNFRPQVRPAVKKEVDLSHILGGLNG